MISILWPRQNILSLVTAVNIAQARPTFKKYRTNTPSRTQRYRLAQIQNNTVLAFETFEVDEWMDMYEEKVQVQNRRSDCQRIVPDHGNDLFLFGRDSACHPALSVLYIGHVFQRSS